MKNKLYFFLSLVIVLLSLCLRLYHFSMRAPFDWDQNRDFVEVGQIAGGNLTLIGPVAKGEGGFLLGPLYYYLLLPAYLLTSGSPLALPITSILFDVAAIVAILVLFRHSFGRRFALVMASFWAFSWMAIEASRISWNVALVPLWTILMIYWLGLRSRYTFWQSLIAGFFLGLAWHIHAALIPLGLMAILIRGRDLLRPRVLAGLVFGYLISISPLILFDLTHAGFQTHLIKSYLEAENSFQDGLMPTIISVISRFGKNIAALLIAVSDLNFTWGIVSTTIALILFISPNRSVRVSVLVILVNLALTVILREVRFPEYYLLAASIAFLVLITYLVTKLDHTRYGLFILGIFAIFLTINFSAYTFTPSSFSLYHKIVLASKLVSYSPELKLNSDLPFGRDSGISALIAGFGGLVTSNSSTTVLLTEKQDPTLFIDGEIAHDLGWFGGIRAAIRAVE